MDPLTAKIEQVTAQLREIEREMMWTDRDDPDNENLRVLDDPHATALLTELKLAVDAMRRFLWAYIEAADRYRGAGANYALQTARLKRATEMLQMLHRDLDGVEGKDAQSLLDRVTKLVRGYEGEPPA